MHLLPPEDRAAGGGRAWACFSSRPGCSACACSRPTRPTSTWRGRCWSPAIGIGLCTAPTTSAIMDAVPDEKQGVASAVNDATREVGAALGIAVAGSVLAAQYSSALAPALAGFPEQVRGRGAGFPRQRTRHCRTDGSAGRPRWPSSPTSAFIDSMDAVIACAGHRAGTSPPRSSRLWAPGRDGTAVQVSCDGRRGGRSLRR